MMIFGETQMHSRPPASAGKPAIRLVLMVLSGLLPLGCATRPSLMLTSSRQHQTYRQEFTRAYACRNDAGGTDVVLVDKATEQSMRGQPMSDPARQIMHIRVMWLPTRDMKAVASNAAIKWYVIGRSAPQDVMAYSGTAFVYLDSDDENSIKVKVTNATLKCGQPQGNMIDPVGPSTMEGTIVARSDAGMVKKLLGDMRTAMAAAEGTPRTVADSGLRDKAIER